MRIDLGPISLAVDERGSGDPFVLMHGYTGGQLDFVDVVDHFATARRVITFDHRGHGESDNTGDPATYTFDQLLADFERLAETLDLERFDLLGHSMGGIIAMRYVLAHPERVRSLVLMDTAAEPAGIIPAEWTSGLVALGRRDGMGAVADLIAQYLTKAAPERSDILAQRLRWKFEHLDVEAFEALARELNQYPSMVARLPEIRGPVTVVVGEADHGLRGGADVLARHIAGATLAVIPDAAHSPQDENRAGWLAAVDAHFRRVQ